MRKLFFAAAIAGAMLFCAVRVHAQEIIHLPAGAFCRLDELLEGREIKAAAVTLLPDDAVLWMGSGPLEPYMPVTARDLGQVFVFSAKDGEIGVTLCGHRLEQPLYRIRSVNPYFPAKDGAQ